MTTNEAAAYLKVKPQTMRLWASQDRGPSYVWIEGARRYDKSGLQAWANGQTVTPGTGAPKFDCSICKKPVKRDGYIGVPATEVARAAREDEAWKAHKAEKQARLGEFAGECIEDNEWDLIPEPARWYTMHIACDTRTDCNDYGYQVERVDTWPKFISFVAHVSSKPWVQKHTDLSALLRRVIGE